MPIKNPNIVIIMFDQVCSDLLRPSAVTCIPNINLIAEEGARFHRCYTVNALCSPARASLMTSTYPSSHGVWDCIHSQRPEWVNLRRDLKHFAHHLKEEGYVTGYFGKWHVEQSKDLTKFGWDEYDLHVGNLSLKTDNSSVIILNHKGYKDLLIAGVAKEFYCDHPAFLKGIDFIRRNASGDRPLCCFVSTSEPHDPYIPVRMCFEQYSDIAIPLPEFIHEPCYDKPEVVVRMKKLWEKLKEDDWKLIVKCYCAILTYLDSQVGKILKVIEEIGLKNNTVVIITSDHGDMLGRFGLLTKGIGTPYEPVYNIPLVMRGPGIPSVGEIKDAIVSTVDIAPTILALAGAKPLPHAQGKSIMEFFKGFSIQNFSEAYAEFYAQRIFYTQRIMWYKNLKYVFTPAGKDEMYDLEHDPLEFKNLIYDPAFSKEAEFMMSKIWGKMQSIGDDSLYNTNYPTLRLAQTGPFLFK